MKLLGIDYGSKKIGIAITDEEQKIAFPRYVLQNDENIFLKIEKVVGEEGVKKIVLGRSMDYDGSPNRLMDQIQSFKKSLEKKLDMKVIYENEFLTTMEAQRIQGRSEMIDASAAALILKTYLEKEKQAKS